MSHRISPHKLNLSCRRLHEKHGTHYGWRYHNGHTVVEPLTDKNLSEFGNEYHFRTDQPRPKNHVQNPDHLDPDPGGREVQPPVGGGAPAGHP